MFHSHTHTPAQLRNAHLSQPLSWPKPPRGLTASKLTPHTSYSHSLIHTHTYIHTHTQSELLPLRCSRLSAARPMLFLSCFFSAAAVAAAAAADASAATLPRLLLHTLQLLCSPRSLRLFFFYFVFFFWSLHFFHFHLLCIFSTQPPLRQFFFRGRLVTGNNFFHWLAPSRSHATLLTRSKMAFFAVPFCVCFYFAFAPSACCCCLCNCVLCFVFAFAFRFCFLVSLQLNFTAKKNRRVAIEKFIYYKWLFLTV